MGQRANLIIVENKDYELYYNHWCANTLTQDIFWGPQHAIDFIKMQQKVDKENGWLDDVWAEGGVVIDTDKKVLLIFGGEDFMFNIPLRRIYLKLLSEVWNDWDIRWAYEGIADLADYVGYPREKVISQIDEEKCNPSFSPPEEKDWTNIIGSIEFEKDEILIFPLYGIVDEYLYNGLEVIEKVNRNFGYNKLILSEWTDEFPCGGFHINAKHKILTFWTADNCSGLLNNLQQKWIGWKINFEYDKFEKQIELSNDKINIYIPPSEMLISKAKEILLRDNNNPADSILELANRISQEGKNVEINSWALRNERLNLDSHVREKTLEKAIRRIKI